MHGTTTSYAVDPVGEYVFGVVLAGGMQVRRGRECHVFGAGDVCAWDPSARHEGRPYRAPHWEGRLLVLELPAVAELMHDPEGMSERGAFPAPRVRDRGLAERFLRLHESLERPAPALARDTLLLEWLQELHGVAGSPDGRARAARRDPALVRACELLADDPLANVGLAQLARAAGVSRHRLTRLFRAAYGVPPHRFQLAQRLRAARRLLEEGVPPAEVAQAAGFFDQSHLHRQLRRTLGMTPAQYAALVRSNVQDASAEAA